MGGPVGAHTRTQEPSRSRRRGKETSLNSGAQPLSPSPVPARGRIPTGWTGRGRRGPLPQRAPAQSPAAGPGGGEGGPGPGKVRVGGGLIPVPPARRPSGGGEPWPLKEEQVGGEEGGGGRRRPVEREELGAEGGAGGQPPRPPHLPSPAQPPAPAGREGGAGSPLSHLKAARSKVGNKKFLFRTFGQRFGTLRLRAGGGVRSRRRRAGEGQRSPDPEPQILTHALPLKAIPVPPEPMQGTHRSEGHRPDRAARGRG